MSTQNKKTEELKINIAEFVNDYEFLKKLKGTLAEKKRKKSETEKKISEIMKSISNQSVTDRKSNLVFELVEKTKKRPITEHLIKAAMEDYPNKDSKGKLIIGIDELIKWIELKRIEQAFTLKYIENCLSKKLKKEDVEKIIGTLSFNIQIYEKKENKNQKLKELSFHLISKLLSQNFKDSEIKSFISILTEYKALNPDSVLIVKKDKKNTIII